MQQNNYRGNTVLLSNLRGTLFKTAKLYIYIVCLNIAGKGEYSRVKINVGNSTIFVDISGFVLNLHK